jgi:hypothetical protein
MLNTTGLGDVLAEELAIFPGMEEVKLSRSYYPVTD